MQTLGVVREEIKDSPVLLDMGLWIWFQSMYHIREFHSITNEKDWEIVSHQIKVTLSSQKLVSRIKPENYST